MKNEPVNSIIFFNRTRFDGPKDLNTKNFFKIRLIY